MGVLNIVLKQARLLFHLLVVKEVGADYTWIKMLALKDGI